VILSQILIITSWQDAKFGTIVNLVFLLAIAIGIGQWQFKNQVDRSKAEIAETSPTIDLTLLDEDDLKKYLPRAVENWTSAYAESRTVGIYQFEQRGRMKLKPDESWREFEARQWSSVHAPEFVWNVDVGKNSFVQFNGLDRLVDGEGRMKISILSLVPVVNKGGPEIDRASAIRYLAEMVWYPEAADRSFVEWEEIDRHTAKATLSAADFEVEGIFFFDGQDRPVRFEAMRHNDETGKPEKWVVAIDAESYFTTDGATIPAKAEITWKLEGGDFTWYQVEVLKRSKLQKAN
jgi:hypothetical protein